MTNNCFFRKLIVDFIESWNGRAQVTEVRCVWDIENEG